MGSLNREKKAFESLIKAKAKMAICLPDLQSELQRDREENGEELELLSSHSHSYSVDTRTVSKGLGGGKGGVGSRGRGQAIVDVREFRSSLPSLLHAGGMQVTPRTLDVGDYVLAPEICVERKGISDLFQSFQSGRLYHQAESMNRYYKHPCLLIEFSGEKGASVSLTTEADIADTVDEKSITSRLSLLALAFPNLRFLWALSPHATPDIFRAISAGHPLPDEAKSLACGAASNSGSSSSSSSSSFSSLAAAETDAADARESAYRILLSLPGINSHNVVAVMDGVESLAALARMTEAELAPLAGPTNAVLLAKFFRQRA